MTDNLQPSVKLPGGGTSKRIGYIDALKGFGIICVVIGHVAQSYLDSNMFPEAEWLLKFMFNATYCFHMPFFFAISGYVYFKAYFYTDSKPRYEKLKVQFVNLIFIYSVFSLIYGFFRIIFAKYANGQTSFTDILMIWARPIAEYWYLYTLIFLYLIFMIPGLLKLKPEIIFFGTVALSLISGYIPSFWSLNSILYYSFFFAVGILIAHGYKLFNSVVFNAVLIAVAAILFIYFKGNVESIAEIQPARIIIALGVSMAVWNLFKKISLIGNNEFLKLCGLHSLEIYIIHGYFTAGNRVLVPMIGITNAYVSIAANFVISMAVPFAAVWITKKLKIYGYIFTPGKMIFKQIKAGEKNV